MAAVDVIDAYVRALPGEGRRLAHGEWGLTVPAEAAAGWPLDVGLRIEEGLLRVQAFAIGADERINPWNFLHWNRGTRLIRFACTRGGDIWVHGDLPLYGVSPSGSPLERAVDERTLDRLLGLVVEGAVAARRAMAEQPGTEAPAEGGWGAVR